MKRNGDATRVIVLNVGYGTHIAVPSEAVLRTLLDALARCQVLDFECVDETYWRERDRMGRIAYDRVNADRVHLDEERPKEERHRDVVDIPRNLIAPPAARPEKLVGRPRLLLGEKRS